MSERIEKLLTIKSIVTILLTVGFLYLSITGKIPPESFLTIFTVVIGFYFGTQHERKNN